MTEPTTEQGHVIADRYRIGELLGRGGMGAVYAGAHLVTGRPVAIKLLNADLAEDRQMLRRFFTEAQSAGQLKHPHVVGVLDMGETSDGLPFIVLERLEGESLAQRVAREGPLDAAEAARVLGPVMDALAAAHDASILHRDLKPANVFLARSHDGALVPKLLDFGIAKLVGVEHSLSTDQGTMVGTPQYMAPEQVRGDKGLDGRIDVWGAGVLLYETMTARRPFDAPNTMAIVMRIIMEPPHPLPEGFPPAVGAVIGRALQKERDARWPDMRAMRDALTAATR